MKFLLLCFLVGFVAAKAVEKPGYEITKEEGTSRTCSPTAVYYTNAQTGSVTMVRNSDGTTSRVTQLGLNCYGMPVARVENLNTGVVSIVGQYANGQYYVQNVNTAPVVTTMSPVVTAAPTTLGPVIVNPTQAPIGTTVGPVVVYPGPGSGNPVVYTTAAPVTQVPVTGTSLFTSVSNTPAQPTTRQTLADGTVQDVTLIGYNTYGYPIYSVRNVNTGKISQVTQQPNGQQAVMYMNK